MTLRTECYHGGDEGIADLLGWLRVAFVDFLPLAESESGWSRLGRRPRNYVHSMVGKLGESCTD